MSRTLLSLAGFQVIISGRFWVIAEVRERRARKDEEQAATLALDELKGWIHKFLEFTTTQTSDAFYGIVFGKLCQTK
jgi:hypothetical protein